MLSNPPNWLPAVLSVCDNFCLLFKHSVQWFFSTVWCIHRCSAPLQTVWATWCGWPIGEGGPPTQRIFSWTSRATHVLIARLQMVSRLSCFLSLFKIHLDIICFDFGFRSLLGMWCAPQGGCLGCSVPHYRPHLVASFHIHYVHQTCWGLYEATTIIKTLTALLTASTSNKQTNEQSNKQILG